MGDTSDILICEIEEKIARLYALCGYTGICLHGSIIAREILAARFPNETFTLVKGWISDYAASPEVGWHIWVETPRGERIDVGARETYLRTGVYPTAWYEAPEGRNITDDDNAEYIIETINANGRSGFANSTTSFFENGMSKELRDVFAYLRYDLLPRG